MPRSVSTNLHPGCVCVFLSTWSSRSCSQALSSSPLTWIATSVRGRTALSVNISMQTGAREGKRRRATPLMIFALRSASGGQRTWFWTSDGAKRRLFTRLRQYTAAISNIRTPNSPGSVFHFIRWACKCTSCKLPLHAFPPCTATAEHVGPSICEPVLPPVRAWLCFSCPPLSTLNTTHLFNSEYNKRKHLIGNILGDNESDTLTRGITVAKVLVDATTVNILASLLLWNIACNDWCNFSRSHWFLRPQVKWLPREGSTHAWHLWLQFIKKTSVMSPGWFTTWSNVYVFFPSCFFHRNVCCCKARDHSWQMICVCTAHSSNILFFPTTSLHIIWR